MWFLATYPLKDKSLLLCLEYFSWLGFLAFEFQGIQKDGTNPENKEISFDPSLDDHHVCCQWVDCEYFAIDDSCPMAYQ